MSAAATHRLKRLRSEKGKLEEQHKQLASEVKNSQRQLSQVDRKLKEIDAEIKDLTEREPVVSEHAILRYLERVKGLNIEEVKAEILDDSLRSKIEVVGSGRFPLRDGCQAIVKNKTIVSVA